MNSKNIVALTDESICMKCLKNKATNTYNIYGRGYGSSFDNNNTHFQLCDDCHEDKYDLWVDESDSGYDNNGDFVGENYKYEKDIIEFISRLPLESQELFDNRFSSGAFSSYMDSQDWIDFELGELPHEKCKEYGLYSPQEKKAYSERFPNCREVKLKTYKDGYANCQCGYGAFGNKDGTAYDHCGTSKCYMCTKYSHRNGDVEVINEVEEYYKNEKNKLIYMLKYAETRLVELEKDVYAYMYNHSQVGEW